MKIPTTQKSNKWKNKNNKDNAYPAQTEFYEF